MNHTSSALAGRFGVVFVLSVLLLSACGGGGGSGTDAIPFTPIDSPSTGLETLVLPNTSSFSPMFAGTDGVDLPMRNWVYRVNDGQPLQVVTEAGVFDLTFPDPMVVSFDPAGGMKVTNLPFRFTGTVLGQLEPSTGLGAAAILERVEPKAGCPQILDRIATLSMSDQAEAPVFTFDARSELEYSVPLEWRPDCEDLMTLDGAGIADPLEPPESHLFGSVTCSAGTEFVRADDFDGLPTTPNLWAVTDVLDELVVQGRVFHDVIAMDLFTVVPDLGDPTSPVGEEARTIRLWFARGVGLIRAEGAFLFWGHPVDVDLVDILR